MAVRPLTWLLALLSAALPAQSGVVVRAGDSDVSTATLQHVEKLVKRGLERLSPVFHGLGLQHATLFVHSDASTMPAELRADLDPGTAGLALLQAQEAHVILDRARLSPPHDLAMVVDHELVHLLLDRWAGAAGPFVPRWVHEGLAQVLAGGTYLGASEEDIIWRVPAGGMLSFTDLAKGFPHGESALRLAYAQSFSFVAFLCDHLGRDAVLAAVRRCGPDTRFDDAVQAETGRVLGYLERDWIDYLQHGSGAVFRVMLESCFSLLLVLALPVLVLAGAKRWNRDLAAQRRLEAAQRAEDTLAGPDEPRCG